MRTPPSDPFVAKRREDSPHSKALRAKIGAMQSFCETFWSAMRPRIAFTYCVYERDLRLYPGAAAMSGLTFAVRL